MNSGGFLVRGGAGANDTIAFFNRWWDLAGATSRWSVYEQGEFLCFRTCGSHLPAAAVSDASRVTPVIQ